MKIYEYIKGDEERTVKLFGLPIMKQTTDYITAERNQSFLGGLITTKKLNSQYTENAKKDIKILGFSIIKRLEENNYRNYYFLGKKFYSTSLFKEFKKQYFKFFDKKYDDIYILQANAGETYLTLTYIINNLIKKNNSKSPLLVATKKYHLDMIKMICPNLPFVYIKGFQLKIIQDSFTIDNFRFFLLYSGIHFRRVEKNIKSNEPGKYHYFKSILDDLNMTENDIDMNKLNILPDSEKSMLEKVNQIGLNINNFIFLAPEAQTCKLYNEDFWVILINQLQEKGYDVFVNLVKNNINLKGANNYKTCNLTFAEVFALAKKSKRIVSLRSGFTEFLIQTDVKMDVLYTKFKHRHFFDDLDIYKVISGFGLMQIPYINKEQIREFNMFEISPKECLEKILRSID